MDKITQYIADEQSRQFSQEKMDEIFLKKIGKSKLSPALQHEFVKAHELAVKRGLSVVTCGWCDGPAIVKDVRVKETPLCDECQKLGATDAIKYQMRRKGEGIRLTPGEMVKVANSRTTRQGPFFDIKHPEKKPGGNRPKPVDRSI